MAEQDNKTMVDFNNISPSQDLEIAGQIIDILESHGFDFSNPEHERKAITILDFVRIII